MPPRLNVPHVPKALALRSKTSAPRKWTVASGNGLALQTRSYADSKKDDSPADTDHNLHVSEEAAAIAKSKGEQGPDLSQGTPVEEVVKGDKKAQEKLPKVIKDALKNDKPSGSRSFSTQASRRPFSTSSRAQAELEARPETGTVPNLPPTMPTASPKLTASAMIESALEGDIFQIKQPDQIAVRGRAKPRHLHERYPNIVDQMVGLIMRDGKKAAAQRNVSLILSHLRTAPPPKLDSTRLLPGHPPPSHLTLNPVLYLTLAIDSVAPILRIKQLKGAAGGGMSLAVAVPLGLRRRRWEAIHWILSAANKRKSRGSGKGMFAQKMAEEIIRVVEGSSSAWTSRDSLHKQAVAARANVPKKAQKSLK